MKKSPKHPIKQAVSQPFPPYPPKAQWDFSGCPEEERFTCLLYECNRIAQEEDPSFADRLEPSWKIKYPMWPRTPYLEIPEKIRRQAQPELGEQLEEIRAREVIPTESIPAEAFDAFQTCIVLGEPPIYESGDGEAYALLKISRGMAPENLLEAVDAYIHLHHAQKALTSRPVGAGSYARDFQADLNTLTAYTLLKTLKPEEATAVTADLLAPAGKRKKQKRLVKRGLYSTVQNWRAARDRGEYLIKKTLEGQLTTVLLSERIESFLGASLSTKST